MRYIFNTRPIAKPRMTRSDRWKQRPCVMSYWAYKDDLLAQAEKMDYILTPSLSVTFLIKVPKSWSKKKKREKIGRPHQQTPDLDNLMKAFKDALTGQDDFVFEYKDCCKFWWNEDKIIVNLDEDNPMDRIFEAESDKAL